MAPQDLRAVVARNIRATAKRRKIPLTVLADRAAVSRAQLFDFLAGRKSTTLEWLAALAEVLDVEPWKLLVDSGEVEPGPARKPTRRRVSSISG